MTQKPTPKTHPNSFIAVLLIDGSTRYRCKAISMGVQEDLTEAYRKRYEALHPEECKDGLSEVKYSAWLRTVEGLKEIDHVAAFVLFVTEDGEPSDPEVYRLIAPDDFREAFNFTMRPLPTSENSLTASTANTASSPATALNSSR